MGICIYQLMSIDYNNQIMIQTRENIQGVLLSHGEEYVNFDISLEKNVEKDYYFWRNILFLTLNILVINFLSINSLKFI